MSGRFSALVRESLRGLNFARYTGKNRFAVRAVGNNNYRNSFVDKIDVVIPPGVVLALLKKRATIFTFEEPPAEAVGKAYRFIFGGGFVGNRRKPVFRSLRYLWRNHHPAELRLKSFLVFNTTSGVNPRNREV